MAKVDQRGWVGTVCYSIGIHTYCIDSLWPYKTKIKYMALNESLMIKVSCLHFLFTLSFPALLITAFGTCIIYSRVTISEYTANIFEVIFTVFSCVPISTAQWCVF